MPFTHAPLVQVLFTLQAAAYTGEPVDDLLAPDDEEARSAARVEPIAERSA